MLIFPSSRAYTLCLMAMNRRNHFNVQSHCVIATATSHSPTPRTHIVLGTALSYTRTDRYCSRTSRTNCDEDLSTVLLFLYRPPTLRLATRTHHLSSKTTFCSTTIVSTIFVRTCLSRSASVIAIMSPRFEHFFSLSVIISYDLTFYQIGFCYQHASTYRSMYDVCLNCNRTIETIISFYSK